MSHSPGASFLAFHRVVMSDFNISTAGWDNGRCLGFWDGGGHVGNKENLETETAVESPLYAVMTERCGLEQHSQEARDRAGTERLWNGSY
jgi:hypothetical protein